MSTIYQIQDNVTTNKKWAIQILLLLHGNNPVRYKQIKQLLHISDSSLSRMLKELTKEKYITKFTFGSIRKPHHTEYEITNLAVEYINNLLSCKTC